MKPTPPLASALLFFSFAGSAAFAQPVLKLPAPPATVYGFVRLQDPAKPSTRVTPR